MLNGEFKRATKIAIFKAIEQAYGAILASRLCLSVPSTAAAETYEWLGQMPGVKEFFDERKYESLKKWEFFIKNRKWENTLKFGVDEIEDNPEIAAPLLPGMAQAAVEHLDELLLEVMIEGEVGKSYDGVAFYSSAHPCEDDKTAYSNLITGSGTSLVQLETDWNNWVAAVKSVKKRGGLHPVVRTIGKPVIFHSPSMEAVMNARFNMTEVTIAGVKETNPLYNKAEPITVGELTGNTWYPNIIDRPMKPFLHQHREDWKFIWEDSEATKFHQDLVYFGGKARYATGYGHPLLSAKIKNS